MRAGLSRPPIKLRWEAQRAEPREPPPSFVPAFLIGDAALVSRLEADHGVAADRARSALTRAHGPFVEQRFGARPRSAAPRLGAAASGSSDAAPSAASAAS